MSFPSPFLNRIIIFASFQVSGILWVVRILLKASVRFSIAELDNIFCDIIDKRVQNTCIQFDVFRVL